MHESARRHGVHPDDAIAAAAGFISERQLEPGNPSRSFRLGYDTAGRLLELVVLVFDSRRVLVVHAMKARSISIEMMLKSRRE